VVQALRGAAGEPLGAAILLVLADRTLMAYRWVVLLCIVDADNRPKLTALMRIFFVSTFVGTFLPASIGGDAVRAYSLSRLNVSSGDSIASVFADRMIGVGSLLLMACVGLVLARDLAGNATVLLSLLAAGAACAFALLLVFSDRAEAGASRMALRLPVRARTVADSLLGSIRRYARYDRQLANVLACSVAVQVLRVVQAYLLGRALGISAPLETYFAFIPLILLVMLLPVTFNGLGTSQAAFVWFFGRAGVAPAEAFALSVLFVGLGIVGNLPGGVLYVLGARAPAAGPVGVNRT
jgi:uncharacterized protein (TIRG00374 family)